MHLLFFILLVNFLIKNNKIDLNIKNCFGFTGLYLHQKDV